MDQRLKERLIGAAVLVALAVWLVPWVLDGPAPDLDTGESSPLQLPTSQEPAPMRTETIDLQQRRGTRGADDAGADGASATPASRVAAEETQAPEQNSASGDDASSGDASGDDASGGESQAGDARTAGGGDRSGGDPPDDTATIAAAEPAPEPAHEPEPEPEPETRAAAPAATEQQTADGAWMVQLGSFGEEGNARRLAARVADVGFAPDVSTYRSGGRLMHRVRIGPHETRDRAEAAASSLSAHGFVAQVVTAD